MTRYSMTLKRLAEKDPRIDEYEYDFGNDNGEHWLHLKYPYTTSYGPSIHEDTVKECLALLSSIHCEKCRNAQCVCKGVAK